MWALFPVDSPFSLDYPCGSTRVVGRNTLKIEKGDTARQGPLLECGRRVRVSQPPPRESPHAAGSIGRGGNHIEAMQSAQLSGPDDLGR